MRRPRGSRHLAGSRGFGDSADSVVAVAVVAMAVAVVLALVVASVLVILVATALAGPVLGLGSTAAAVALTAAGKHSTGPGCHEGERQNRSDSS